MRRLVTDKVVDTEADRPDTADLPDNHPAVDTEDRPASLPADMVRQANPAAMDRLVNPVVITRRNSKATARKATADNRSRRRRKEAAA